MAKLRRSLLLSAESMPTALRKATLALLPAIVFVAPAAAPAAAADGKRTIHYRGQAVAVPAAWPVHRLAAEPNRCVRYDRRAVYIGSPGVEQRCPAHAAGRPRAIVIRAEGGALRVTRGAPLPAAPAAPVGKVGAPRARATASAATYFTGLGFDACAAPSTTTLSAWAASPYRAVGVYIGGINRACSQPNLTSTWVASVIGAGWVLIPTYVGLQAPQDTCGCASISPSQAVSQGTAAADDAVAQAAALGIGPGNPIYNDMEYYPRGGSNTPAVLSFLGAWTARLHARGYLSGVYGSATSVVRDLVSVYGSSYASPDDIWVANWNGLTTTADPNIPDTYWANHQRIHQYRGGHNERYGGVTINIDNNYLDGAVVGNASSPLLRTRLRCPKVVLVRRPRVVAYKIRAFNLLHCSKARKVAAVSRLRRYAPSGTDRSYVKKRMRCSGEMLSSTRVFFTCTGKRSKVLFVRKG
jgi:hypothetical protein